MGTPLLTMPSTQWPTMLSTQWPTMLSLPPLSPMPSMPLPLMPLPPLLTSPPPLTKLRNTPMRFLPTPSPTPLHDYSKANFNAEETSDGASNVQGGYSVALPDGRIQHVKYSSNGYDGYVADVTYEGTAVYPEAKPYAPAPAPAYHD